MHIARSLFALSLCTLAAAAQSRPVPASRPTTPTAAEIGAILGSRSFGKYRNGEKHGYVRFTYARPGGPDSELTATTEEVGTSGTPPFESMERSTESFVFDAMPPHGLRSASYEEARWFIRDFRPGSKFELQQHDHDSTLTRTDTIDSVITSTVPRIDLTFGQFAADLLFVRRQPSVGESVQPRRLLLASPTRRASASTAKTSPWRVVSDELVVTGITADAAGTHYAMKESTAPGIDGGRICDADGWLARGSSGGTAAVREELVGEPHDVAQSVCDVEGRLRVPITLASPADRADMVESLTIRLPAAIGALLPTGVATGAPPPGIDGIDVVLPQGAHAATPADRAAFAEAGAAATSDAQDETAAWAREAAGTPGDRRGQLARLRAAVSTLRQLSDDERAVRLAVGIRDIGLPCRVVRGHAVTTKAATKLSPHAWVEVLEGDTVVAVDPVAERIPAPPTRLPMQLADATARAALAPLCAGLHGAVLTMTVRDVGVPDLRAAIGASAFSPATSVPTAAQLRRSLQQADRTPDGMEEDPATRPSEAGADSRSRSETDIDLPGAIASSRRKAHFVMLSAFTEALRAAATRDQWGEADVDIARVTAEYLGGLTDTPPVTPTVTDAASARAAAHAMGAWLKQQIKTPAFLAACVGWIDDGPYVGFPVPLDIAFAETVGTVPVGDTTLTLGRAVIDGKTQSILRASRAGRALWARVICNPEREPLERLAIGNPSPSALGSAGCRVDLGGHRRTSVYLNTEAGFMFYFRSW